MAGNSEIKRETTMRDFLNVVFRRKILILAIVLFATIAVVFLNTRQATIYESNSRILVKRGERTNVFSNHVRYLGWEEEVASQIELILSEAVFKKARGILADSASVWGDRYKTGFKGGRVRASVIGESNVYSIGYMDSDPVFARRACAAVTLAYKEYYKDRSTPPAMTDFFVSQIQDIAAELDYWKKRKNDFLNKSVYLGMSEEGRFILHKISDFEGRITDLEGKISERKINVDNLKALTEVEPKDIENSLSFSTSNNYFQSGIMSNIKFNLNNLHMRKKELLHRFTDNHPQVVEVISQISDLQKVLKNEIVTMYKLEKGQLDELINKKQRFQNELEEARASLDEIPDKEMEMQKIKAKLDILEDKYRLLLVKQDEAEIAMASTPQWEITILSRAGMAYPKKTKDYIRIALGPFFSFIIALGIAFFFESLDHSLKNTAEVEEYLNLPVLGTISDLKMKK